MTPYLSLKPAVSPACATARRLHALSLHRNETG